MKAIDAIAITPVASQPIIDHAREIVKSPSIFHIGRHTHEERHDRNGDDGVDHGRPHQRLDWANREHIRRGSHEGCGGDGGIC
jgi:hypothetical protein